MFNLFKVTLQHDKENEYNASPCGTIPEKVLKLYFVQTGIIPSGNIVGECYELQSNELVLFHYLGVPPTTIEIKIVI